jgi:hypothetical protein
MTLQTRANSGRAILIVLTILLLVGGGGYNYQRNLVAEQAEQGERPFKGYQENDLRDLETAYGAEVEGRRGRYQELATRRVKTRDSAVFLDEKVADFERIQRAGDEKRALAGLVAEHRARLNEIQAELAYRDYVNSGMAVHVRRLTTI